VESSFVSASRLKFAERPRKHASFKTASHYRDKKRDSQTSESRRSVTSAECRCCYDAGLSVFVPGGILVCCLARAINCSTFPRSG
jgi:hypothetical protein